MNPKSLGWKGRINTEQRLKFEKLILEKQFKILELCFFYYNTHVSHARH